MSLKKMSLFLLRSTSSRNTPPSRRSEWGSSLPPGCFVSRGTIWPCEYFLTMFFFSRGGVVSTSPNAQARGPPLVGCPRFEIITFYKSLIILYGAIVITDLYSTTDFRLFTCVTFASLFQIEAADFRDKSVSITRTEGQAKEQTNPRLDLRET